MTIAWLYDNKMEYGYMLWLVQSVAVVSTIWITPSMLLDRKLVRKLSKGRMQWQPKLKTI